MRDENEDLSSFESPPYPEGYMWEGDYVRLEALDVDCHVGDLFESYSGDEGLWEYFPVGPFARESDLRSWLEVMKERDDVYTYVLWDKSREVYGGVASFLRVEPRVGSIEVGYIALSRGLRGTRVSTEAMYLMMRWVFEVGYRRYEWKCHALNERSKRAAERLGFLYEGTFRQATIMRGRNRDTAWYSCIDKEWKWLKEAYETWLSEDNFDEKGEQKLRLSGLMTIKRVE